MAANFSPCQLHIPHKNDHDDQSMRENWSSIERWVNERFPGCASGNSPTFDQRGPLAAGAVSDPWNHPTGGTTTTVVASLEHAGTTGTVVDIRKSGVVILTFTIPAGAVFHQEALTTTYRAGGVDVLTVATPTPGSGASGLVVTVAF